MENIFYSLHDFYTHSKSVTYIAMGLGLLGLLGWCLFLTGRDDDDADTATRPRKH